MALTIVASVGSLLLSLISGVLTARLLGPEGRGQVATISAWTLTFSWLAAMGFGHAMIYYRNRHHVRSAVVVSTTAAVMPGLGLCGVIIAQAVMPLGFAAQTEETRDLARIFLCAVPLILITETSWSILSATRQFVMLNLVRLLQPLLYVATLLVLWGVGSFTPVTVLTAQAASYALTAVFAFWRLFAAAGRARPSRGLTWQGLKYGIRLQGVTFGSLVSTRLDLMMLPAFVGAVALGQYSIAVNVASMVLAVFGTLSLVVFPLASAGDSADSVVLLERSVRMTLMGAAMLTLVLGVFGPQLIGLVYGEDFVSAAEPLRLLLPGVVFWSVTSILGAGLQAHGAPGRASLAQILGMVTTIVGLAVALDPFGINGAAAVSSIAYTVAFAASSLALRSVSDFRLRSALAVHHMKSDLVWVLRRCRTLLSRGRAPKETA